jgi:Peptidase A4 family
MENGNYSITAQQHTANQARRASRMFTIAFGLATIVGLSSLALAQVAPAESVAVDQSNASGAIFYAAPAAGFNSLTASDVELAQYGFPPRPDATSPKLLAHWQKMVTAPQKRLTNLKVQATNVVSGMPKAVNKTASPTGGPATSNNWSGYAVGAPSGTFQPNNSFIFGEWIVPVAQQTFYTCNGAWDYSVQWVGFDGWGSGDVLQAGSEADAYCSGGTKYTYYSLWYEWFVTGCTVNTATEPCNMWRTSLAASPGDLVGVEVWYTTTAPQGHAYIVNYTTQQSTSLGFNEPPGQATYAGNSAEWIVERPTVGGALPNLTNYVAAPFNVDYAYNGSSYFYPGSSPAGTTIYNITMTCPPWNPSSGCTYPGLSSAILEGVYELWFGDEGVAY